MAEKIQKKPYLSTGSRRVCQIPKIIKRFHVFFLLFFSFTLCASVQVRVETGLDRLFTSEYLDHLKGEKIGLVTNHTAISKDGAHSIELFLKNQKRGNYKLAALFAPEHGLNGNQYAWEKVEGGKVLGINLFSLHGTTRRPTKEMLKGLDLIVFDIQDIGSRSYTYISTLFYVMEEAAKEKIKVLVLDRPNPINGVAVDGIRVEEPFRSFIGYINIPYIHGMTVGELASYFNREYQVNCSLDVIPMKGWRRSMDFEDTGLTWIPTSPHIPERDTPLYYPVTGILGEMQNVSIGIGYTLPFKVVGAPWIDAKAFAKKLQEQKFPGVEFYPFHFRPFFGRYAKKDCQGVLIRVSDPRVYRPIGTLFLVLGVLKSLYPKEFAQGIKTFAERRQLIDKLTGSKQIYDAVTKNRYFIWPLMEKLQKERDLFLKKREAYLIKEYPL